MRAQRGFALVEVMVAAAILAVGVLGVLSMIDAANATTGKNKLREGATNLAREVIENVDTLPYSAIDPTTLVGTLQSKPDLANAGSGPAWTVVRRGVRYTVTVSVCNIDDPRDGSGSHDSSFCPGTATGSSDAQPIDYKRVTVTTNPGTSPFTQVRQSTLMFPSGNTTVASVTNLTSDIGPTITSSANTAVNFTATTDRAPFGVEWFVDDTPKGTATGGGTSWTFTWPIGSLPDGTYVVSARAFNSAGAYGAPYQLTFTLNRNAPLAPGGFNAGWNPANSSVDSEWFDNAEGDIAGYHVWRQQVSPTVGPVELVNCGTAAQPNYLPSKSECTDAAPISQTASAVTAGAATSNAVNRATSLTISKPAGVAAGDVMVASVAASGSPSGSWPSGWNLVTGGYTASNNLLSGVLYKVATASEPASYTFGSSSRQDLSGGIVAYSNVDTASPFEMPNAATGASGNAVGPSITTTQANERVLQAVAFAGVTTALVPTVPSGMTQRFRANASSSLALVADQSQLVAGATGAFTTVPNGPDTGWIAQTLALKPASSIRVNYWVTAVDKDPQGNLRDGPPSPVINAYAPNNPPSPPTWSATPLTTLPDGTKQLQWNVSPGDPDSGDSVAFYRIYRDGQRYDTTGAGTDTTWIDTDPRGTTHTYQLRAVDTHEAESSATSGVTG